jgi:hypothetical protein
MEPSGPLKGLLYISCSCYLAIFVSFSCQGRLYCVTFVQVFILHCRIFVGDFWSTEKPLTSQQRICPTTLLNIVLHLKCSSERQLFL